jgi:hypothetical protein
MGWLLLHLWAAGAAVYCVVQVVQVTRSYIRREAEPWLFLWGFVSAYLALEIGGLALGLPGPLLLLVAYTH